MNPRSPYHHRTDLSPEELEGFLRQARELPAVRVEKVVTVREALRHHRYDLERRLDKTASRLAGELDNSDISDQ